MNWETQSDIHTLLILFMKQITSENLLHGTGNSTQCSSVIQMGKKPKKEGIYVYIQLIDFAVQ